MVKNTWNDFYFQKYIKINLWLDVIKPMDVPCVTRENVQQMGGKLGVFIMFISLIVLSTSAVSLLIMFGCSCHYWKWSMESIIAINFKI